MEAQLNDWQDILKNTLEPQLAALEAERKAHTEAAREFADLKILISALIKRRKLASGEEPLIAMCEIEKGSGKYEHVEVSDTSVIHVDMGDENFLELKLDDAVVAVEKRQKYFEGCAAETTAKIDKLQRDIWKGMSVVYQLNTMHQLDSSHQ